MTYKKETLFASFPAYDVFTRAASMVVEIENAETGEVVDTEVIEVTASDVLGLRAPRGYYREYQPGSVVSYSLQYNDDPIAAVEDAKKRGHALQWINGCAVAITAHEQAKRRLVKVEIGMVIRFEGIFSRIEKAPNDNLKLVPVKRK